MTRAKPPATARGPPGDITRPVEIAAASGGPIASGHADSLHVTITALNARTWSAYAAAWLAAAGVWTLASASSSGMSALETLPYGLFAMSSGAIMGVAVWRLTGRLAWEGRPRTFYLIHALAMLLYTTIYATSWTWPDLATGHFRSAWRELRGSQALLWNLLMGSWLYLIVVGISYAIRAQRRVQQQAAAAAEAQVLAQQAQLAALRAQINPHFLFNALHSVGALVTSDPARADQALERLGQLLRYALGTNDAILFAQEWQFTLDYLAFEQLRLGDRLIVTTDAAPSVMSLIVPPLILQPIVENAVRHGIAPRLEGGRLDVRARLTGRQCVITVRDDGRGPLTTSSEGLGLGIVRRRLAVLYRDEASLTSQVTDAGFEVTIALPAAKDDGV